MERIIRCILNIVFVFSFMSCHTQVLDSNRIDYIIISQPILNLECKITDRNQIMHLSKAFNSNRKEHVKFGAEYIATVYYDDAEIKSFGFSGHYLKTEGGQYSTSDNLSEIVKPYFKNR